MRLHDDESDTSRDMSSVGKHIGVIFNGEAKIATQTLRKEEVREDGKWVGGCLVEG
ncbi:hypothetical protein A2U01_0112297, partial [Trifolium medium]|nr:hypothetical protein [Trifolium medium]